jgi:uncharacterized protein
VDDEPAGPTSRGAAPRGLIAAIAVFVAAGIVAVGVMLVPDTGPGADTADKPAPTVEVPRGVEGVDPAASAEFESAKNPFYTLAPPDTDPCELPVLNPASTADWEEFAPAAVECLDGLWRPLLAELDLDPPAPTVELAGSHEQWSGLYQGNEITIFLDEVAADAPAIPDEAQQGVWTGLMAHEYGHWLQDHLGILAHADARSREADDEDEAQEHHRRVELQAECLSGVSMRAAAQYTDGDVNAVNDLQHGREDSPTHGEVGNRKRWFLLGWHARTLEDCNTFVAAPELVR